MKVRLLEILIHCHEYTDDKMYRLFMFNAYKANFSVGRSCYDYKQNYYTLFKINGR